MTEVLFHADDYGLSVEQSQTVLSCSSACGGTGALNSLSVMANTDAFEPCAALLEPYVGKIHVGVHLNIVEGRPISDPEKIPLLVGENGMFSQSFVHLLRASKGQQAAELERQIESEYLAQIQRMVGRFPYLREHLRLDSHQHFHLIPVAFDALLGAARRSGCNVEFIRVPIEPARPYRASAGVFFSVRPVNWVKHWVLNSLWKDDAPKMPDYKDISAVFSGIAFSGRMDEERVRAVLPRYLEEADRQGMKLELLFHPGKLADASECPDPSLQGFVDFHVSDDRMVEADALHGLAGALE